MVAAPRDVYSALVVNVTGAPLRVTATYTLPNNADPVVKQFDVEPEAHATFDEISVSMGTWDARAVISGIALESQGAGSHLAAPFMGVTSPTQGFVIKVHALDNIEYSRA